MERRQFVATGRDAVAVARRRTVVRTTRGCRRRDDDDDDYVGGRIHLDRVPVVNPDDCRIACGWVAGE